MWVCARLHVRVRVSVRLCSYASVLMCLCLPIIFPSWRFGWRVSVSPEVLSRIGLFLFTLSESHLGSPPLSRGLVQLSATPLLYGATCPGFVLSVVSAANFELFLPSRNMPRSGVLSPASGPQVLDVLPMPRVIRLFGLSALGSWIDALKIPLVSGK